ncbi:hypothetical protein ABW19_dt0200482 [Dactylella cylindrospora]|nr:hypothetical protein ABW19_dt0200482 [Dactylella cylindrospora]
MTFYVAPTLRQQKQFFRNWTPKPWPWPASWFLWLRIPFRTPRSGLTWFNVVWIGVFQYCFIRVVTTFITLVTQWYGVYCEDSWSGQFAHVYIIVIVFVMIAVALYVLVAFYTALKQELDPYRPFLKFLSIKLVIFFVFWQALLISWLMSYHILKPSKYVSEADLGTGINAVIVSFEMFIFAIMHLYAYPWKDYTSQGLAVRYQKLGVGSEGLDTSHKGGKFGWRAWVEAFNFWDFIKATARGLRWLFVGRKRRHIESLYDASDETDKFKFSTKGDDDDEEILLRAQSNPSQQTLPLRTSSLPTASVESLPPHLQDTSYHSQQQPPMPYSPDPFRDPQQSGYR